MPGVGDGAAGRSRTPEARPSADEPTWPGLGDPTLSMPCPICLPSHSCPSTSFPLQLLGKTDPAATSSWGAEGEPPSQHAGSAGAGAPAGLGNAGFLVFFFPLPTPREVGGEAQLAGIVHCFAALQAFSITNGTLATLTQERGPHQGPSIVVTHTPLEGTKAGDLAPRLLCRMRFGGFPPDYCGVLV